MDNNERLQSDVGETTRVRGSYSENQKSNVCLGKEEERLTRAGKCFGHGKSCENER